MDIVEVAFLFTSVCFLFFGLKTILQRRRKLYPGYIGHGTFDLPLRLFFGKMVLRGKEAVVVGWAYIITGIIFGLIFLYKLQ